MSTRQSIHEQLDPGDLVDSAVSATEVVHHVGVLDLFALALLLLGAFNWGVVAFFGFDWIDAAFGVMSPFTRSLHAAFGCASIYAVYMIGRLFKKAG